MGGLFWLTKAQMRLISPHFPLSHGVARVDDRRAVSSIVFVLKSGLRWRDAPAAYGPHKTRTTASTAGAAWACSTASSSCS
jgi:Transposase and inactivated derivatives